MAAAQQTIPLPPGWEAKYDPGQRRYFFINHQTQTTTWEDPRVSLLQPKQPQPSWQQASPYSGHASGSSPHHGRSPRHSPRQSTENIALRDMSNVPKWQKEIENKYNIQVNTLGQEDDYEVESHSPAAARKETTFSNVDEEKVSKLKRAFPTAGDWAIRNALGSNNNQEDLAAANLERSGYHKQSAQSQIKENNLVNKLKKEFPSAEEDVIRDIIQCVDQNEMRATQELKALGYPHNTLHNVTPKQPTPARKDSSSTSSQRSTPSRSSPAKDSQTPKKAKGMSAESRKRLKAKLATEYDYTENTIEMIINAAKGDESRARQLIERLAKSKERSTSTLSSTTAVQANGTAPVAFTMPDFTIPTPSISSVMSGGHKGRTSTITVTSAKKTAPKKTTKTVPKQRTSAVAVHRTTTPGAFVSSNRTPANGPDPSLAHGPDKDMLIKEYLGRHGPDSSIRHGPNPGFRGEIEMYYGPDPALRNGPDRSLHCGANKALAEGPMYGNSPILVRL